jgi:ligand-binding sensor domain-containing protein
MPGLREFDLLTFGGRSYRKIEHSVEGKSQPKVLIDRGGQLWIGAVERGVSHRAGDEWVFLGTDDGLPSRRVRALLEDREASYGSPRPPASAAGTAR